MRMLSFHRFLVVLMTFLVLGSAQASEEQCGDEEVISATRQVLTTTEDMRFALDVFSRSLAGDRPLVFEAPAAALAQARRASNQLKREMRTLAALIDGASPDRAHIAEGALRQAKVRGAALEDATQWFESPSTGGVGGVDWCSGFIDCIGLRHGCGDGCYKCYEGLTDCACYTPPDDIKGCS
jgi:hypothetical protein